MKRRPTAEEVKYGRSANDGTNASSSSPSPPATSSDEFLQVARIRRGRIWSFVLIVVLAINMMVGTMLSVRQLVFYRRWMTWFDVAWIPQSALVVYAMFGLPVCNPLRKIIPERVVDIHKRKIVVLAFVHVLVLGSFVVYDMLAAWIATYGRGHQHRQSTTRAMPTLWRVQVLLLCAFILNIVFSEYREYVLPSWLYRRVSNNNNNDNDNADTTKESRARLGSLPTTPPPSPTTPSWSSLVGPPMHHGSVDKAHSTYYVCPGTKEASLFAFDQPAFLLLTLGPMTALEFSTILHYMLSYNDSRGDGTSMVHEWIGTIARAMFKERSVRLIARDLPGHATALVTAERTLWNMYPPTDFLTREVVLAVKHATNNASAGVVNDLDALCSKRALQVLDAEAIRNHTVLSKQRASVEKMFQHAWSMLFHPTTSTNGEDMSHDRALALVAESHHRLVAMNPHHGLLLQKPASSLLPSSLSRRRNGHHRRQSSQEYCY